MKKHLLLAGVALLAACTYQPDVVVPVTDDIFTVSFAPQNRAQMDAQSIADLCTNLDVWFISGDETIEVHQSSGETGFGTVAISLNKTKTYTMHAVAHKAGAAATLSDNIIAWPNDKVTHILYSTATFSPANTTSIASTMKRLVGQFNLSTTDALPDDVTSVKFTIYDTDTRYNVSTGAHTNTIDREATFSSLSTRQDGTLSFILYIMSSDAAAETYDIRAQVFKGDDEIENRLFEDVEIRNGYKTTYSGALFVTTPMNITFSVADWNTFDPVAF